MAIHKLDLGEFDEIDYYLIAIHTSLEDYRLAFFINQLLPINLSKSTNEIQITIEEGETQFSRFYYYDTEKAIAWNLIQNKNEVIHFKSGMNQNLFSNVTMEVSIKVFLLPEFKKVDYFLKIETIEDTMSVAAIQTILNTIEGISALYTVDTNQIKSKNNLIF